MAYQHDGYYNWSQYAMPATAFATPYYGATTSYQQQSALSDSGYMTDQSPQLWSTPHSSRPSQQQQLQHSSFQTPSSSSYGTVHIHYNTTPASVRRTTPTGHSPFQLSNPNGAFEYRFNGDSLSQLPRGALIEMGSPDAAALETPKRRRLHDLTNATPSGSQAQQQWHYRATQATVKSDVYRPLHLTDADKENIMPSVNVKYEAAAMVRYQSAQYPTNTMHYEYSNEGSNSQPAFEFHHNYTGATPAPPASAPPQMPQPLHNMHAQRHLMHSPTNQHVKMEPKTPTPFKRKLQEMAHRTSGTPPVPDDLQDLREILRRDSSEFMPFDTSTTPSKYIGDLLSNGYSPIKPASISMPSRPVSTFEQAPTPQNTFVSHRNALSFNDENSQASIELPPLKFDKHIPIVEPPVLSDEWMKIACGRTPPQVAMTKTAREFLANYRKNTLLIALDTPQKSS